MHDRVVIGLVPTTLPWEALAHLRLGGWNECPTPAEHVAILKWWHERYGAELVPQVVAWPRPEGTHVRGRKED